MRKHFFDKRIVLGVAVAFTVTSSLSLITSLNSDSLGTNTLFPKNSDFSVVAKLPLRLPTLNLYCPALPLPWIQAVSLLPLTQAA